MVVRYTDQEIELLLLERKPLAMGWQSRTRVMTKRRHQEQHVEINGDGGSKFRMILRQSTVNVLDFSVILAVCIPQSNQMFRLRRYNGKSHEHTNRIEGGSFYDFHIHFCDRAVSGDRSAGNAYAEPTDRYETSQDALCCLLADTGFYVPPEPQRDLFEEEGDVD